MQPPATSRSKKGEEEDTSPPLKHSNGKDQRIKDEKNLKVNKRERGGVFPGEWCVLPRGVYLPEGVCFPGGAPAGGGIPACTEADTPPPPTVNRMTDRCL